jgi:hypothetical protein
LTASECCVGALFITNGAMWAFGINDGASLGCLDAQASTCAAGQASNGVNNIAQVGDDQTADPVYALSNSYCGAWNVLS